MGVIEVWFDPETGRAEPAGERGAPGRRWRVICEGDAVSILGSAGRGKGKGKVGLIGSARWSGKGLGQRYAVADPIAPRTWGQLEHAMRQAVARAAEGGGGGEGAGGGGEGAGGGDDRPSTARESAAVFESAFAGEPVAAAAVSSAPEQVTPAGPPPDRRSGWWAFAAFGVALAGTLVSWLAIPPGDDVGLAITITLGLVTLGLGIYGAYGLGTRCPSCRAWYRRETTSSVVTGTSTFTREESKPVYDSSGKQTGTTYETATYERTDYRYYYRCKECSHRWTGTGSSERRIG